MTCLAAAYLERFSQLLLDLGGLLCFRTAVADEDRSCDGAEEAGRNKCTSCPCRPLEARLYDQSMRNDEEGRRTDSNPTCTRTA